MPESAHRIDVARDFLGFDACPLGTIEAQAMLEQPKRPVGVGHPMGQ